MRDEDLLVVVAYLAAVLVLWCVVRLDEALQHKDLELMVARANVDNVLDELHKRKAPGAAEVA